MKTKVRIEAEKNILMTDLLLSGKYTKKVVPAKPKHQPKAKSIKDQLQ